MIHFLFVLMIIAIIFPFVFAILISDWFGALCKVVGIVGEFLLKCGCWFLIVGFVIAVITIVIDLVLRANGYAQLFNSI